jgi:diguanylate cyclase (GGDEF)-like protein
MERIQVFSIVMMDIDDFKHVNDTFGHDVGDVVLVGLADIIRDEVRAGDYSCRWGGEEFLLFANGPRNEVQSVAERILERLRNTQFEDKKGGTFSVTLTAEVAEFRYGAQLRNVIDAADKRLYYGKTHGKNQVVSAS